MAIQRWEPFGDLRRMEDTMNRLWRGFWGSPVDGDGHWTLPLDVVDRGDRFLVHASLPGVKPGDARVSIEDGVLTIRAHSEERTEDRREEYVLRERRYGSSSRSIRLPRSVDADRVEATYENGVLTVALPKTEASRGREVKVNAAGQAA